MQEILPGLYQITLEIKKLGPGSVNTYLIRDHTGYTIIDAGWDIPECAASLESQLAEIGARFSQIQTVILTHCHHDHLGLMARFKKLNQATVYLHHAEIDLIKVRYNSKNDFWQETDRFLQCNGLEKSDQPPWGSEFAVLEYLDPSDILLQGGELIQVGEYTLQVIHTPGHTPGHISLYEPRQKFLISGDVLLPTIVPNAAGHIQHMVNPLFQYAHSLEILSAMDIDLVLPGHEYVFTGHRKRIAEITEHYRQKRAAVSRIFNSNPQPLTAGDVARQMTWTLRARIVSWDRLNSVDRRFAVLQTIALLEEQACAGKLNRLSQNGMTFYQLRMNN